MVNKTKIPNINLHSFLFTKKINNQYKLVPFYTSFNQRGETRYLPPVAKEWKNHVYNYNNNNSVNFPIYDLNINSLIKGYFSMYFNNKLLNSKYIPRRRKRILLRKIYVSKAEIKHTNNKAIITIYIFNKERPILKEGLKDLTIYYKGLYNFWLKFLKITKNNVLQNTNINTDTINNSLIRGELDLKPESKPESKITVTGKGMAADNFFKFLFKFIIRNENLISNKKYRTSWKKTEQSLLPKDIINDSKDFFLKIRRLKLKINLNKYKLENKFLFKLSRLISKYYNKKVEFNIVNLKSLANNNDIFTQLLTQKLKKERSNPISLMNSLLARVIFPEVNPVIERGRIQKQVNSSFIPNKYKNLNISNIISNINENSNQISTNFNFESEQKVTGMTTEKDNFSTILYENFYTYPVSKLEGLDLNTKILAAPVPVTVTGTKGSGSDLESNSLSLTEGEFSNPESPYFEKIRKIILSNIKYKNMAGAKFIVKGRLTRRYRADRALYKYKWKGGLKNIDSAFKGIPGVVFRGYLDSNVERSTMSSKRRIGSFGIRSWLAGK
jgi:hypothetical protein